MALGHVKRGQNSFLKTTRAGEGDKKEGDREREKDRESQLGSLPSTEERNERQQVGQASEGDKDFKKLTMGERGTQ